MSKFLNYFRNKSDIILMESKKILKINGKDSIKFLNNICTANIIQLQTYSPALFLDAKGKILTKSDIFKNNETFYIEIEKKYSKDLMNSMSKFTFKKDVKIEENSGIDLFLVSKKVKQFNDILFKYENITRDFDKILVNNSNNIITNYINSVENNKHEKVELLKEEIVEGIADHETIHMKFPSFFNFDIMNYIDYKKGCYLGQELTQRTKFSNSTNKRMFIFEIKSESNKISSASDIYVDMEKEIISEIESKDLNIYNEKDKIVGSIIKQYNPLPFVSAFIIKDYFSIKEGDSFHIKNGKNNKYALETVYKPNI